MGTFEDGSKGTYCDVVQILHAASRSEMLSIKAWFDAKTILDNMIRYQHILTAMTYLPIMEKTSALSKYLQTYRLDLTNAFNMALATTDDIKQIYRNFSIVVTQTDHFVKHANEILDDHGCNIIIKSTFPSKRIRKNKNEILDVDFTDLQEKFEVDVLNRIMDLLIQSLERRFASHRKLYVDLSYFDPKRFSETLLNKIPILCCKHDMRLLPNKGEDSLVVQQGLRQELLNFASKWSELQKITSAYYADLDGPDELGLWHYYLPYR